MYKCTGQIKAYLGAPESASVIAATSIDVCRSTQYFGCEARVVVDPSRTSQSPHRADITDIRKIHTRRSLPRNKPTTPMPGAEEPVDDGFTSITWDQPPTSHHAPPGVFTNNERPPLPESVPSSVDRADQRPMAMEGASREGEHTMPSWGGKWMAVEVREPTKEHEGTKEMYVSYAVRTRVSLKFLCAPTPYRAEAQRYSEQTNLAGFPTTPVTVRRRFQDFVFLRDHLTRLFPACVVPPIPDKHRLGTSFDPVE
jgi:hypothetical protein